VNIIPKALTEIKVQSRPSDSEYVEGQELNEEGLTVVGIYNDDSERVLEKSEYTLDGYNKNIIGEQTITVKSLEFTDTFTVTVIKKIVDSI
ncbi:Ig-like domain (group 3), partial [Proteiniclasticum ruminis]